MERLNGAETIADEDRKKGERKKKKRRRELHINGVEKEEDGIYRRCSAAVSPH